MNICNNCKSKIIQKSWNGKGFIDKGITKIPKSNMIEDKENCSCNNKKSEFYQNSININNNCKYFS